MNNIFISSSFRDMQAERDAIRYVVLPGINELLRTQYGQETTIIDLRWGIDTSKDSEVDSMKKILRICLVEIQHCRPFMIVLLGDRYGTFADSETLDQVLREFPDFTIKNREISVTELEIRYAIHLASMGKMECHFYFRDMDYALAPQDVLDRIYFDDVERDRKREKLAALKEELQCRFPDNCQTYLARWDHNSERICDMDYFVKSVTDDLKNHIQRQCNIPSTDECMRNIAMSEMAFENSKRKLFVGRWDEFSKICSFLKSDTENLMLMRGDPGCGKSALLTNLIHHLPDDGFEIVRVFCGNGSMCDTAGGLLKNIVWKLSCLTDQKGKIAFQETHTDKYWRDQMDGLIEQYIECSGKTLVFLIDAVDQLIQDIHTQNFYYLPGFSKRVKVIITADSQYQICQDALVFAEVVELTMGDPSQEEIMSTITGIWSIYGKPSVSLDLSQAIFQKPLSNNYLYLNILLTRLSYIGEELFGNEKNSSTYIEDSITTIVQVFPDSLECAAVELLKSMGRYINSPLFDQIILFLCASKNGLKISDLQAICGDRWDAVTFSHIMRLLGTFVFERSDHRIDFSHKIFRQYLAIMPHAEQQEHYVALYRYAETLPKEDPNRIHYLVHSAYMAGMLQNLYGELKEWLLVPAQKAESAWEISTLIRLDKEAVTAVVDAFPQEIVSSELVDFFSKDVAELLSADQRSIHLYDLLSEKLSERFANTADVNILEALCQFETVHHSFRKGYFDEFDTKALDKAITYAQELYSWERVHRCASSRYTYRYFDLGLKQRDRDLRFNRKMSAYLASQCISSLRNDNTPQARLLCAKAYVKLAGDAYSEVIIKWNEKGEDFLHAALETMTEISRPEYWFPFAQILYDIGNIYMRVGGMRGSHLENSLIRDQFYRRAEDFYTIAKSWCLPRLKTAEWKDALDITANIIHQENIIQYRGSRVNADIVERSAFEDSIRETLSCIKKYIQQLPSPQKYSQLYAELCCIYADYYGSQIEESAPYDYVFTYEEALELYDMLSEWDNWFKRGIAVYQRIYRANRSPKNLEKMCEIIMNRILLLTWFRPQSIDSIEAKFKGAGRLEECQQRDEENRQKEKLELQIQASEIFEELTKYSLEDYLSYYLVSVNNVYHNICRRCEEGRDIDSETEQRLSYVTRRYLSHVEEICNRNSSLTIHLLHLVGTDALEKIVMHGQKLPFLCLEEHNRGVLLKKRVNDVTKEKDSLFGVRMKSGGHPVEYGKFGEDYYYRLKNCRL